MLGTGWPSTSSSSPSPLPWCVPTPPAGLLRWLSLSQGCEHLRIRAIHLLVTVTLTASFKDACQLACAGLSSVRSQQLCSHLSAHAGHGHTEDSNVVWQCAHKKTWLCKACECGLCCCLQMVATYCRGIIPGDLPSPVSDHAYSFICMITS